MRDEGHIVANHGFEHKLDVDANDADAFPDYQTSTTDAALTESLIDQYQDPFTPSYFRFPGGAADETSLQNLEAQGLASVGWNLNSSDYSYDHLDTRSKQRKWEKESDGAAFSHSTDAGEEGPRRYQPAEDDALRPEEVPRTYAEKSYLNKLTAQRDEEGGGVVLMHDAFREYPTNKADANEAGPGHTSELDWYDKMGLLDEKGEYLDDAHMYMGESPESELPAQTSADRATARRAFAETRGRGFTARMLRAFIEDSIALDKETGLPKYTFVGLDDMEAFPTTNAYARACDPLPFVRRELFEQMLEISGLALEHLQTSVEQREEVLNLLVELAYFDLSWETMDAFVDAVQLYRSLSDECTL
jgi:hypothetical protein